MDSLDLIFKNQAMATRDKGQGQFVNDLLRTEFHKYVYLNLICIRLLTKLVSRKFMQKFIKVGVGYSPIKMNANLLFAVTGALYIHVVIFVIQALRLYPWPPTSRYVLASKKQADRHLDLSYY